MRQNNVRARDSLFFYYKEQKQILTWNILEMVKRYRRHGGAAELANLSETQFRSLYDSITIGLIDSLIIMQPMQYMCLVSL